MSNRSRILTFGGAGMLVLVGLACGVAIGGGAGEVLALVLIGLGLVAAVSLVFYEVGLSEDHERTRQEQRRSAASRASRPRAGRLLRPPSRLDRMRGRRRRLR